jgi:hypothetical protein
MMMVDHLALENVVGVVYEEVGVVEVEEHQHHSRSSSTSRSISSRCSRCPKRGDAGTWSNSWSCPQKGDAHARLVPERSPVPKHLHPRTLLDGMLSL